MNIPEKTYPLSYPHDVLRIISAMSFSKGRNVRVMGSLGLRSQLYAADYDCFEVVERSDPSDANVLSDFAKEFQSLVKDIQKIPNCIITDIKAGSVEEWRVLPEGISIQGNKILNLDIKKCRRKIEKLERNNILSQREADSYLEQLTESITPEQYVIVKKDIRPHIVRWNAEDVARGYKTLQDKRQFTLEEAFSSPVITKLDLIAWVQGNRFAEFSMIYKFVNQKRALNLHSENVEQALKESILYYSLSNRWFKVAKRMFSYARFHDDVKTLKLLTPFLNSDLGRLYVILSDIETILMMLDADQKVSKAKIFFELDQMRGRFANIYAIPNFLKIEFQVVKLLESALRSSNHSITDNIGLVQDLNNIARLILMILNNESEIELIKLGLLPLPKQFAF